MYIYFLIIRKAAEEIKLLAAQFKAVAVVGPRQSGKTTLVRMVFGHKPYVNLENPDVRRYAMEDPLDRKMLEIIQASLETSDIKTRNC